LTAEDARIHDATWLAGSKDAGGIVLGQRTAEFLNASVGSRVAIGHGSFSVVGILRTKNGFEDGGVFMPLGMAQHFFHKQSESSVITVKLKNRNDQAAFKDMVKQQYPNLIALQDEEFDRSYSQFKILKATAWAVGACGLLLGGLGVANTMIMSVFTRIREIAILRVNGFSNLQIAGMIFGESGVVSIFGAVTGLIIGVSFVMALKTVPVLHGYIDSDIRPVIVMAVVLLAVLTGVAGALYPAFYAMRIRAVEALRFE